MLRVVAGLVCQSRPHCTSAARAAVHISIDSDDPARSWHLELEVCIVGYRIESGECGSSKQCVVTTTERDDIED